MWTKFWDMHSGGSQKLDWPFIFIEAPEEEAKSVFYARFHRNPERVTCTCCGKDYSIDEEESLAQITAYHRGCMYDVKAHCYLEEHSKKSYKKYQTLEEYVESGECKVIYASEILESEKYISVPDEGYVWAGS